MGTYLIICGTVTLEFSSNAFIMSPLQRMLSTHWNQRGVGIRAPPPSQAPHQGGGWHAWPDAGSSRLRVSSGTASLGCVWRPAPLQ